MAVLEKQGQSRLARTLSTGLSDEIGDIFVLANRKHPEGACRLADAGMRAVIGEGTSLDRTLRDVGYANIDFISTHRGAPLSSTPRFRAERLNGKTTAPVTEGCLDRGGCGR